MVRIINDMLPTGGKSPRGIRQIPIPEHRPAPTIHTQATGRAAKSERQHIKEVIREQRQVLNDEPLDEYTETTARHEGATLERHSHSSAIHRSRNSKWLKSTLITVGILLVTVGILFLITSVFSYANVKVTPIVLSVNMTKDNYLIKLNASSSNELPYELMTLSEEGSKTLAAKGEEQVNIKASGQITIYNTTLFSQRLINNTRFEAVDGRVYRINNSIVIPGGKKEGDKIVPGSIEALVYADVPGEKYNMKIADLGGDFTVPGFAGTPKFKEFYARLSTDMIGGFSGLRKKVEPAELEKATTDLKKEISTILIRKAYVSIPETHHLFNNAYFVETEILDPEASTEDTYVLKIKSTLHAVIFDNARLAEYIATKKIEKTSNIDFKMLEPQWGETLTMTIVNPSEKPWLDKTLSIILDGPINLEGVIDADDIKAKLVGKNGSEFGSIIAGYPMISKFEVEFKPRWKKVFSDNPEDIHIKNLLK